MQSAPGILLQQVTIANGESLSTAAYLGGGDLVGVLTPETWTDASIRLQGSLDGINFFPMQDGNGNDVLLSVPSGVQVFLSLTVQIRITALWIKALSETDGTPVDQEQDCVITLMIRKAAIESLR